MLVLWPSTISFISAQHTHTHQVQEEFDSVDRMWKSLPTDAELVDRQALTQEEVVIAVE